MSDDVLGMWEVLVPTVRNDGRPYRKRFHRVWDAKVRAISGGLTIVPPVRGQWISREGQLFVERMIPVRLIATRAQLDQVIDLTLKHYDDQLAVLAYRIADEVVLRHRS